jgi:hypothetical protein
VRRIATIRPRYNIAAKTTTATRSAMTPGATVRESGAKSQIVIDVANTVFSEWAVTLAAEKLALEKLTSASDSAKWIATDYERRRIRCCEVAATDANLLSV